MSPWCIPSRKGYNEGVACRDAISVCSHGSARDQNNQLSPCQAAEQAARQVCLFLSLLLIGFYSNNSMLALCHCTCLIPVTILRRLYVKGTFVGFQRSRSVQKPGVSLIQIDGVRCREDTEFYLGKRIAYVYRAKKEKDGSRYRVIWGKVRRAHGNSGVVRATFRRNLPAAAMGSTVRVMLYPSRI